MSVCVMNLQSVFSPIGAGRSFSTPDQTIWIAAGIGGFLFLVLLVVVTIFICR